METKYEISLRMKTANGMEEYGCFTIGTDENFASRLYKSLQGDQLISSRSVITTELIKWENGIPCPVDLMHCSYEQLAENVKIITKELFKQINLE